MKRRTAYGVLLEFRRVLFRSGLASRTRTGSQAEDDKRETLVDQQLLPVKDQKSDVEETAVDLGVRHTINKKSESFHIFGHS